MDECDANIMDMIVCNVPETLIIREAELPARSIEVCSCRT